MGKDNIEEFLPRFLHLSCSLIWCFFSGLCLQHCRGNTGTEVLLPIRQGPQLLEGRLVVFLRVRDLFLSIGKDLNAREGTGTMKVKIRNQVIAVELVDAGGERLRDVEVGHVFADDCSVLRLRKTIVVGMARSALRLLCFPSLQESRNNLIDVLATVVTVEISDDEREERKRFIERRFYADFLQIFHSNGDLPLRHLIHMVDVVDALLTVAIALMHGINAEESRLSVWSWFPAFPDGRLHRVRLLMRRGAQMVSLRSPKTVEVGDGDILQSCVAMVSLFILLLHNHNRGCPIEPQMEIIRYCEELDVALKVCLGWLVADVGGEDGFVVLVRCDVPCNLCAGETGNFHDVPPNNLLLRALEHHVPEANEGMADPL